MNKKTAVVAIICVLLIALVGIGAAFAFFPNESDSQYLVIGSNDKFSISIGVGESQGTLVPAKAVNDNTANAVSGISDSDGVRIKVPYVIGEGEEGVVALKVVVYASSAVWTDGNGDRLADGIQSYMNGKLDFCIYGESDTPVYEWNNVSAFYTFDVADAGASGNLILAVRFNVTDELLPEEIKNATLTVSLTSEFVRA